MKQKGITKMYWVWGLGLSLSLCGNAHAEIVENLDENSLSSYVINQKDIVLVEGKIVYDSASLSQTKAIISSGGKKIDFNCYTVLLEADAASDPSMPKIVPLRLCFPVNATEATSWALPIKEHLLLLVRKTNQTYEIVGPKSGWMIVPSGMETKLTPENKVSFILDALTEFLKERRTSKRSIFYSYDLKRPETAITFEQDDPALLQALRYGERLGLTDAVFNAAVEQYADYPMIVGETARGILACSGEFGDIQNRMVKFEQNKLDPIGQFNFPHELQQIVRSSDLDKAAPFLASIASSSDSRIRLIVATGLRSRNTNEPKLYSLLMAMMLRDNDNDVRLEAMAGIYEAIKRVKKSTLRASRLKLPVSKEDFNAHIDEYIAPYAKWWELNKADYEKEKGAAAF